MCAAGAQSSSSLQQATRNQDARDSEVARLQRCPECGSANYSEEIVDYTPPTSG